MPTGHGHNEYVNKPEACNTTQVRVFTVLLEVEDQLRPGSVINLEAPRSPKPEVDHLVLQVVLVAQQLAEEAERP